MSGQPINISPPIDLPAIAELKSQAQWVAWRYEQRGDAKPTKILVNPYTGRNASTSNPATWGIHEAAAKRAKTVDGVGFVLSDDDNLTGYDLDSCRNPKTGHIKPWAREILSFGETYAEVSPSS